MSDWGRGHYERTAEELLPAAERIIDVAAPGPGARVLDLACGTGNAAELAARRGAQVSGIDSAPRLIEVARTSAAAAGLDIDYAVADALALPFADAAFDVAVSVFGLIFVLPAPDAVAELLRVVRPGGRVVFSTWTPEGPLFEAGRIARTAMRGPPPASPPPNWGDPDVVRSLLDGHEVTITSERLAFTASSPADMVDRLLGYHPVYLAAVEAAGEDALRGPLTSLFEATNEDPSAWQATSTWLLVDVNR